MTKKQKKQMLEQTDDCSASRAQSARKLDKILKKLDDVIYELNDLDIDTLETMSNIKYERKKLETKKFSLLE